MEKSYIDKSNCPVITAMCWSGDFCQMLEFCHDADLVKAGLLIPTPKGGKLADIGDYILCDKSGIYSVVSSTEFNRRFIEVKVNDEQDEF